MELRNKAVSLLLFTLLCFFSLGFSKRREFQLSQGSSQIIQGNAPEPLHFHEMEEDEETDNLFKELEEGKREHRKVKKHTFPDGSVHLSDSSYEFHPKLKPLDRKKSVKSIKCVGSRLVIKVSDEDFADSLEEGDRLYFGPKWKSGCHKHSKQNKDTHFSLFEVKEVLSTKEKGDDYVVELSVQPLQAPALYKRAIFNVAYGVPTDDSSLEVHHLEKRGFSDFIRGLVHKNPSLDIDKETTLRKRISFKPTNIWLVKVWGNITFSLTAGLTVNYEDSTMKEFSVLLDLGLDVVTKAQLEVTFSKSLWSVSVPIMPPIPIPIPVGPGVAITLHPSFDIEIGISLSTTIVSNVFPFVFKFHIGKELKYLNRPGQKKGWSLESLQDNPFSGTNVGLPTSLEWDSSAFSFVIDPTFSLGIGIDGIAIGGPKLHLPLTFKLSATPSCALNLNVTAGVSISLDIDIEVFIFRVFTKELISKELFKREIWGKCYTLSQLSGILKKIARGLGRRGLGIGPLRRSSSVSSVGQKKKPNPFRRAVNALKFRRKPTTAPRRAPRPAPKPKDDDY